MRTPGYGHASPRAATPATSSFVMPHTLRDYLLIADGERGALLGPDGEIAWLCVPTWDSDAVFAGLIGGQGRYLIRPVGPYVFNGGYEPGSLIWRGRWIGTEGSVRVRIALAFPGDPDRAVLLYQARAVDADARLHVELEPRDGYGHCPAGPPHRQGDVWVGRTRAARWRWSGAGDARAVDGRLVSEPVLRAGASLDLVFEVSTARLPARPPHPAATWRATEAAWRRAAPEPRATIATRDARHAVAVLRGLTSRTGAMVAAATLGLPERSGSGLGYDYRYAWVRDQCYAGVAAATAGVDALFENAVEWTSARILQDGPSLRPAYTTRGGPLPEESDLKLPGYPGGASIAGNHATDQFQLDVWGEATQLLALAARDGRLDADGLRALRVAVGTIAERWRQPDAGIWELEPAHWTHSRLSCVAALRAVADVPGLGRLGDDCAELAKVILADATSRCLHPDGYWRRQPGDDGTDAALLLPPVRGALPAHDPRTERTFREVRQTLSRDGFIYRFAHDDKPLGEAEGAFLLCGFTMALAAHHQGQHTAAARWFERNRAACGVAGLFTEEFDVEARQPRGNLPQAFVHALLLETAARLYEGPAGRP